MDLQNIFLTLWNMSLTGSVIICIVLLARLFLRRAPKVFSYVLWSVVLFRLLCPVSVSSVISVLSFTKVAEPVSRSAVTVMDYSSLDLPGFPVLVEGPEESEATAPPRAEEAPAAPEIPAEDPLIPEVPVPAYPQTPAESGPDAVQYAVMIWLVGLGVMLAYNVYSCIRLFRQIESAVPLRRELYLADHISTAFVLGIFEPKIYLPSYLTPEERGYIIAHERCHIKRMDHVFRLLAYLALCLHWFNPLVWLAFVLSGKDMEMSCDEAVIRMYGPRIRAEYAQSLLRLATGRRSFALTPLAFGEGDTKERVINMSKWKKPKLWATIIALMVCVAVLVACAVNPTAENRQTESAGTPATVEPEETYWDENTDVEQVCVDALRKYLDSESYLFRYESSLREEPLTAEYRKSGENYLVQYSGSVPVGSNLYYDGRYASFYGDYWVWEESKFGFGSDEFLQRWSPEFVETTHWSAGKNFVTFDGTWSHAILENEYYDGSITYTFNPDGTLESISREYVLRKGDALVSGSIDRIIPVKEDPADTEAAIRAVAEQCIPVEELEQRRRDAQTVSEIPSNKTQFDIMYELGSSQMRWYFFGEDWQFAFGAEDATPTSAVLIHTESNDDHRSLVAEETFWLEELVDGKWRYLDESKKEVSAEKQSMDVAWNKKDTYTIDWSGSYGPLKPGFYRLGRYYTVTMNSGESETRPCYAKFRIMDAETEDLVKTCLDAMENLRNWNHHIKIYEYVGNDVFQCFNTEQWKCGDMYLARSVKTRVDGSVGVDGLMYRDHTSYDLSWAGESVDSDVAHWKHLAYGDARSFGLWSGRFEPYDDQITSALRDGNSIIITLGDVFYGDDEDDSVVLTYDFDEGGQLIHAKRVYIPKPNYTPEDMVLEIELTVLDTPGIQIKDTIMGQDVSKPTAFDYEMDVEEFPEAKKNGFVNETVQTVKGMPDAVRLADRECTLSVQDSKTGERYNITEVFYDKTAGIWKVVFRYSQDFGGQAIYINDQGITQMTVTYTEENDPDNR